MSREPTRLYMRSYNADRKLHGPRPRAKQPRHWTPEQDALLGNGPDRIVAIVVGRSPKAVMQRRDQIGIARYIRRKPRRHPDGYVTEQIAASDPLYVMARSTGTVMQHRLVMARHLGRPLAADEFVHHRNGLKHDNRIANLELWTRSHPHGQRVEEVFAWCVEFVERYSPDVLDPDTTIFGCC